MRFELRPGVRRLFRLPLHTHAAADADADEELASLFAARVEHLIARGLSPEAARAEALRRLGTSVDDVRTHLHHSAQHRERHMRLRELWDDLLHDLRYAARGLARRPAFTAVAVLTLAIGIGATTAIFSAVNVLLLRPLPFAHPGELMKVSMTTPSRNGQPGRNDMVWSYPKFLTFRDAQRVFSNLALYTDGQFTVTSGEPERIGGEYVGATYFRTLGLPIPVGRDFDVAEDAAPGAPRLIILSSAFWERRFNADPAAVGHTLDLNGQPYTVVGVAPPGFLGLIGQAQVFIPITTAPAEDLNEAYSHSYWLVARRKPGISVGQAQTAVTTLGAQVDAAWPGPPGFGGGHWGALAQPLDVFRLAPILKRSLLIVFGAVGLVLLIACVNVANLLLGRASARRREIAVRLAIGASRARLVRLLLTESVLLAVVGAAAGLVIAWFGVRGLSALVPPTALRAQNESGVNAVAFSAIRLDGRALMFALGVAVATGILFGLVPALGAARASLSSALKGAAGDTTRFVRAHGTAAHRILVVAEVALAVVLLAGSGLMLRSLSKLLAIDPGFDPQNVLTLRISVTPGSVARDSLPGFYAQLLDRLRALPGVVDASMNNCAPLSGGCAGTDIRRLDHPEIDLDHSPLTSIDWASPSWFSTMHVPLVRGRLFTATDRAGMPKVLVINQAAAKQFWPNEDPIGKHVEVGQGGFDDAEVIGIVGDVRQSPDSAAKPDVYLPFAQSPRSGMMIFIRTRNAPEQLVLDVRRVLREVAPRYPAYDVQTMTGRAAAALAQERFSAVLLGLFAAAALALGTFSSVHCLTSN